MKIKRKLENLLEWLPAPLLILFLILLFPILFVVYGDPEEEMCYKKEVYCSECGRITLQKLVEWRNDGSLEFECLDCGTKNREV